MFYCKKCAEKNKWPSGFSLSYGLCEICGVLAACTDRPSASLPMPEKDDNDDDEEIHRSRY